MFPVRQRLEDWMLGRGLGTAGAWYLGGGLRTIRRFFGPRRPLQAEPGSLSCRPLFVVGCGRSGNTLVRAILVASGEIAIPPESYVLGRVVGSYREHSFLGWRETVRIVVGEFASHPEFSRWEVETGALIRRAAALPRPQQTLANLLDVIYCEYARQHGLAAAMWGDKTPLNYRWLPWLSLTFPRARFVHLLRDGRDVVASYLRAGLADTVEQACDRWVSSVAACRSHARSVSPQDWLDIRYEDLVTEPADEVRRLAAFVGVPFSRSMLSPEQVASGLGDTSLSHHARVAAPIDSRSVGNWRETLSKSDRIVVSTRLEGCLRSTGYIFDSGG